jgi:hypothetical protein
MPSTVKSRSDDAAVGIACMVDTAFEKQKHKSAKECSLKLQRNMLLNTIDICAKSKDASPNTC